MPAHRDLKERFNEKYVVNPESGCWEWTASINKYNGYGYISVKICEGHFAPQPAHRVSYELNVGQIPEGHDIHHKCENKKCVNPDHLEALTEKRHTMLHDGPTAINASKLFCNQGHELNSENTYVYSKNGHRQCRECKRLREAAFFSENPGYKRRRWAENLEENRQKQRDYLFRKTGRVVEPRVPKIVLPSRANSAKTHCNKGHEFTEENTYIVEKSGHRQCKICKYETGKKVYSKFSPEKLEQIRSDAKERRRIWRENNLKLYGKTTPPKPQNDCVSD
jgi:hypothetical protein